MHVYGMLAPSEKNIENFVKKGKYITPGLTIRSVKLYSDGSLGSRTALLKQPYSDDPGKTGILANPKDSIIKICQLAYNTWIPGQYSCHRGFCSQNGIGYLQ